MAEPEANGGGVALELEVATGAAVEETGDEVPDDGGLEHDEEGAELGGVVAVFEGVEIAPGGAGAGPDAASPTGEWTAGHWGLLCGCVFLLCGLKPAASVEGRAEALQLREGAQPCAPTTVALRRAQGERGRPYGSMVRGGGETWEREVAADSGVDK
jgi:hypothetical protein